MELRGVGKAATTELRKDGGTEGLAASAAVPGVLGLRGMRGSPASWRAGPAHRGTLVFLMLWLHVALGGCTLVLCSLLPQMGAPDALYFK